MASRRAISGSKGRHKRRPGVKPTVGLVVEGDAEFEALPRLFLKSLVKGCPPLRATNLGGVGSHCTPVAIAKMAIGSVIAHQAAGRAKVVLVIDREQRSNCIGSFASAVRAALVSELESRDRSPDNVHVVAADRAFEAWLLADAHGLRARGKLVRTPTWGSFEGSLGRGGTKGKDDLCWLLDRGYSETGDGPKLFEMLDFRAARRFGPGQRGSRSLDKFLRTLGI